MKSLLKSRKFWLMVLDALIATLLLIFAEFEDAIFVIVTMQPTLITLIVALTVEDVQRLTDFEPLPPLIYLFKSRRFWYMMLDLAITFFGYFGLKYMSLASFETAKWAIMTYKPILITMIAAVTAEDIMQTELEAGEAAAMEWDELRKLYMTQPMENNDHTDNPVPPENPQQE